MTSNQADGAAWDDVALAVLEQLGRPTAPIDPIVIAKALGLSVELADIPTARLLDCTIEVARGATPRRRAWLVAHELGHWALRQHGREDSERAADRCGEAIMLPAYCFDAGHWDLVALQQAHSHATLETVARRVLSLEHRARLGVWRGPRLLRYRDEHGPCAKRVTGFEAALAGAADRRGGVVQGEGFLGFVDDDLPRRVITLCRQDLGATGVFEVPSPLQASLARHGQGRG